VSNSGKAGITLGLAADRRAATLQNIAACSGPGAGCGRYAEAAHPPLIPRAAGAELESAARPIVSAFILGGSATSIDLRQAVDAQPRANFADMEQKDRLFLAPVMLAGLGTMALTSIAALPR
jgi:hypothetical protein